MADVITKEVNIEMREKLPDGTYKIKYPKTKGSQVIANDGVTTFESHLTDYTLQVPFGGTTTNSGNNYSIASPAISALTAGMAIAIKINANSTGATTLNWNGKGAKPIKKANGTDVTNLKAGGIYTLRYDGTNFILQGEGASGNATASDLLSGKTATTDAGEIVGTMPNRGAVVNTITTQDGQYTIPAGYHNGAGKVTASFANLVAANIKKGVNIGGVVGSFPNVDLLVLGNTEYVASASKSRSIWPFKMTPQTYYISYTRQAGYTYGWRVWPITATGTTQRVIICGVTPNVDYQYDIVFGITPRGYYDTDSNRENVPTIVYEQYHLSQNKPIYCILEFSASAGTPLDLALGNTFGSPNINISCIFTI